MSSDPIESVLSRIDRNAAATAAQIDQRTIYRGDMLTSFNGDEWQDNAINGEAIDVWIGALDPADVPDDDIEINQEFFAHNPNDLPWDRFDQVDVPVAGGLSLNLGTADHFSHRTTDLGMVLYLDTSKIPAELQPIEYSYDWFNAHPGALGRVETVEDGEVFVNGDLFGTVTVKPNEPPTIQAAGRQRVGERTTSATYESEAEVLAFSPEIDLDSALRGAATFYRSGAGTTDTAQAVLNNVEGFAQVPRMGSGDIDISGFTEAELLERLHNVVARESEYVPDPYWSISLEPRNRLDKRDRAVSDGAVAVAYDGRRVVEDASEIPDWVLGRD